MKIGSLADVPMARVLAPAQAWRSVAARLTAGSSRAVTFLDARMGLLISVWIVVVAVMGAAKVAEAAPFAPGETAALLLPYLIVAAAPVAGYRIAAASFPRGMITAQPEIRLSRYGRWRSLDPVTARRNPAYGPIGLMASLLIGVLLNVPTRVLEYLVAVPAVTADAPHWAQVYFLVMTADVVVLGFFYMVCFVLALRGNPLFPRMLLFAWALDLMMQLLIGHRLAILPDLPAHLTEPLVTLLRGNMIKVLISGFVWLPYVILSERVNVTYRLRTMAPA